MTLSISWPIFYKRMIYDTKNVIKGANTHYDVTNFGVDFEYLENGA